MSPPMTARAARVYRAVDLESAPKPQVLDRLLSRLLDDVELAATAIGRGQLDVKAGAIDHATCIVTELTAALDHAAAPELCANLASLYTFVQDRLSSANRSLEVDPLRQAARILDHLRESFRAACARP